MIDSKELKHKCAYTGCSEKGLYRAPKSPQNPRIHTWLCLTHIREHNAAWNCFAGLSPVEIEKEIRKATVWERPTWPFGKGPLASQKKKNKADTCTRLPERIRTALSLLDLDPPASLSAVKARHRALVKVFHPDTNGGDRKKVERFHEIQQAFATLRDYYAKTKTSSLKDGHKK